MKITESQLKAIVAESVKKVINENDIDIPNKIDNLKKMSRTYKKDTLDDKFSLSKTWNRGMGIQSFIQVLPDEGKILYNALTAKSRDLERVRQMFPEYELIKVDKPYWSTSSLRATRNNNQ